MFTIYLVKVEHKIQLTHIVKVFIQHLEVYLHSILLVCCGLNCYLDKVVNGLKIEQVVVRDIHTNTEVQSGVSRNPLALNLTLFHVAKLPSVDDLEVSEFHKVCMFSVSHGDNRMNFLNKLLFLLILLKVGDNFGHDALIMFLVFTSKCMYHLASLVLPALFWIIINLIPILDLEIRLYSFMR